MEGLEILMCIHTKIVIIRESSDSVYFLARSSFTIVCNSHISSNDKFLFFKFITYMCI